MATVNIYNPLLIFFFTFFLIFNAFLIYHFRSFLHFTKQRYEPQPDTEKLSWDDPDRLPTGLLGRDIAMQQPVN
jgi:hypothetical protein